MSRTKMALDVVHDLRLLADSMEALANALADGAPSENERPVEKPIAQTVTQPASQSVLQPGTKIDATAEKPLSLVELRAFVAERSTPENRPKIKALLTKYGVAKLTELPEAQYEALKCEVAAL